MLFQQYTKTAQLPDEWDSLADNYFQQRKFLIHAEKYNPCRQQYFLCFENENVVAVAAAIVYTIQLDIFTYLKIKSPVRMNIVGIPCSVSGQGIFGKSSAVEALKKHICEAEKGLVVFLNLTEKPLESKNSSGKTLPTILLSNQFTDWKDYLASLRSNYRRRLKQINQENTALQFEKKPCAAFTPEMYNQYLEVYKRSSGKLEKLSFNFFQNLPSEFLLTVCYLNENTIGWNIALENKNIYYFFLGGIDYKLNRIYNTYLRLLSRLIRDGIERKVALIELGQTAEIAKMRMGGKPETLYMEAFHSNRIFNKLLKLSSPMLEYKRKLENTNAIKE